MATLLLVEDAPIIREPLARLLESEGFTVHAAANGNEALSLIDQHPIDLILLDVMMPRMNGTEFIEVLRAGDDARSANTAIICITGTFDPLVLERLRSLGVNKIVLKGKFDFMDLLKAIHSELSHRAAATAV